MTSCASELTLWVVSSIPAVKSGSDQRITKPNCLLFGLRRCDGAVGDAARLTFPPLLLLRLALIPCESGLQPQSPSSPAVLRRTHLSRQRSSCFFGLNGLGENFLPASSDGSRRASCQGPGNPLKVKEMGLFSSSPLLQSPVSHRRVHLNPSIHPSVDPSIFYAHPGSGRSEAEPTIGPQAEGRSAMLV